MPLEQPDQQHLRSAHGYVELGMFEEANAELEEIDPFCRALPEVLIARVAIYQGLRRWELMAIVAEKLVEWNPNDPGHFISLAYATRRKIVRVLAGLAEELTIQQVQRVNNYAAGASALSSLSRLFLSISRY